MGQLETVKPFTEELSHIHSLCLVPSVLRQELLGTFTDDKN